MKLVATPQALWRAWAVWLVLGAGGLGLAFAWHGSRVAAALQRVEQVSVLEEMGRSVVIQLERALAMGIPLQDLAGLESWLSSQERASGLVTGFAITLPSGLVLAQHGNPTAGAPQPPGAKGAVPDGSALLQVSVGVHDPRNQQEVARLHLQGAALRVLWEPVLTTGALTLVGSLLVLWALQRWWARHLEGRLARIRTQLECLATGGVIGGEVLTPAGGDHELAWLDQAIAQRWFGLRQRQLQLLQKLNEVRAAHFDAGVLQQIDALAAPLLALPPGQAVQAPEAAVLAQQQWHNRGLGRRVSLLLWTGWLLSLVLLLALQVLESRRLVRLRTQAQLDRLEAAMQTRLALDLQRLDTWLQPSVALAVSESGLAAVQSMLPDTVHWWMRTSHGQHWRTQDGGDRSDAPAPASDALQDALPLPGPAHDLWLAAGGQQLRLGLAKSVDLASGGVAVVGASMPLKTTLEGLARDLGSEFALADHRGQVLGVDAAGLIARWHSARREPIAPDDGGDRWLLSLPLTSRSGHTVGHVVVELAESVRLQHGALGSAGGGWLAFVGWLVLGAVAWATRRQLVPVTLAARKLSRLAESGASADHGDVIVPALNRDVANIERRLDGLQALRRSRARQGRRQARFIRHQMLELAHRLDEPARADVLRDLQALQSARFESASAPVGPHGSGDSLPRFERVVDEVGVLAQGFQSLLGKVGDQYQVLGRLVAQLRDALRDQAQLIAIQQELDIAHRMQQAFLPQDFSGQAGVAIHALTWPAREVGGDFYDFFRLDEHRLAVLVADVSGKGIPAAFFMVVSRTLMRAVAQFGTGPADCLRRLNDLLASDNAETMFVTLFYAVLDTRSGAVTYGNAGHNPPYLVRSDGRVEVLESLGNLALAVLPEMAYAERSLHLHAGDALFLFTDGVTEACDPQGGWFGEERLEHWLTEHASAGAVASVTRGLADAVRSFEAGADPSDDLTCLLLRFQPDTAVSTAPARP